MLVHPTLDLLADLGLHGMSKAFQELEVQPETKALEHAALDHPAGHAGLIVGAIASTITIDPGATVHVAGFKSEHWPASSESADFAQPSSLDRRRASLFYHKRDDTLAHFTYRSA